MSEPADGTLFPAAWTRPRFAFSGGGATAKVVLSTPRMRHPLTIYSATVPVLLPAEAWDALSSPSITRTSPLFDHERWCDGDWNLPDRARRGGWQHGLPGFDGDDPGRTDERLYGFGVGDEGVIRAMYPGDIGGTAISDNANLTEQGQADRRSLDLRGLPCLTPDGKAVASMDDWSWNLRIYQHRGGNGGRRAGVSGRVRARLCR